MARMFEIIQFTDGNGDPLSGGEVYWYDAGTTTPKDTYTDQGAGTPAANPVVLDSEGRPDHGSGAAAMWLDGSYKMVLKDSSGTTITTLDVINEYDMVDLTGLTATIADLNSTTTTSVTKNTTYTVQVADRGKTILCDATTGAFTVDLPAAATAGNKFKIIIKKIDTSTNAVTVDPSGVETIDTRTTFGLNDLNDFIEAQSDGSNWNVVASHQRGTTKSLAATDTLTLDDRDKTILCDASGGGFTVNLPAAGTCASGFKVTIKKTDASANGVTIDPSGAQTIDGEATIGLTEEDQAVTFTSDGSNWQILSDYKYVETQYANGTFFGFKSEQDAGDPDHDIVVYEGYCRGENDLVNIAIADGSSFTKRIDASWASGSGNGGFPTGISIAIDTCYHIFMIAKADGTVDMGYDSSITATNLLADATGYVDYKRVGSVITDGSSNILDYINYVTPSKRAFWFKTPQVDISASNPGTAAVTVNMTLPTNIDPIAIYNVVVSNRANIIVYFSSPDFDDVAPSYTVAPLAQVSVESLTGAPWGANLASASQIMVPSNSAGALRYRCDVSAATTNLYVAAAGWIE